MMINIEKEWRFMDTLPKNNRLRFHLAKGKNYMNWQLRNKVDDILEYYSPSKFQYTIFNGKLNNSKKTASKIHDGSNKTVCSWISFPRGSKDLSNFNRQDCVRISYNPRVKPYWTVADNVADHNIDGFQGNVYIEDKTLYVLKRELITFLENKIDGQV